MVQTEKENMTSRNAMLGRITTLHQFYTKAIKHKVTKKSYSGMSALYPPPSWEMWTA
jgi:hypothetical protein